MRAGFRNGMPDRLYICLNTSYPTNHRFVLLRLVGDVTVFTGYRQVSVWLPLLKRETL